MSLANDIRGLESLPLKLMIIALVASLSIIPAAEALDALKNKDLLNRVELQLERIVSTAQVLTIEGPGSARTIEIDFSSDGELSVERAVIGDGAGRSNMSSVVVRFTNGATMVETCTDPSVWMRARDGSGLVVESPRWELRMSAHIDGAAVYVLAEAA